jgi:hypothetical protein
MDAQRQAFLDDIEAELVAPRPGTSSGAGSRSTTAGYSKRLAGKMGAVGAVLVASASLFGFTATAAHASTGGSVRPATVDSCFEPNFVHWDHTKSCGLAFVSFHYLNTIADPYEVCYVFDATYFGCGGATDIGEKVACR